MTTRTDAMGRMRMPAASPRRIARLAAMALVLALAGTVLPGCPQGRKAPSVAPAPAAEQRVPVATLASQLRLQVIRSSSQCATLGDRYNSVMLMGPPRPALMVNGRRLGPVPRITVSRGQLEVPGSLAAAIRPYLRGAPTPPVVDPPGGPGQPPVQTPHAPREVRGSVVLDAGHGGHDPGTADRRRGGIVEKDVNLDVVLRVRERLVARGVRVTLVRDRDVFVELDDRVAMSNRLRPDLFVSVHVNHAENRTARGFMVYVYNEASAASVRAGTTMASALRSAGIPMWGKGLFRGNLKVTRETNAPAMLVEVGFASHPIEAVSLASPAYRQRIAEGIASGILQHLGSR